MTLLSIKFSFWMSRASDASWSPRDKERLRRNVLQLRVSKWPQGGHEADGIWIQRPGMNPVRPFIFWSAKKWLGKAGGRYASSVRPQRCDGTQGTGVMHVKEGKERGWVETQKVLVGRFTLSWNERVTPCRWWMGKLWFPLLESSRVCVFTRNTKTGPRGRD